MLMIIGVLKSIARWMNAEETTSATRDIRSMYWDNKAGSQLGRF